METNLTNNITRETTEFLLFTGLILFYPSVNAFIFELVPMKLILPGIADVPISSIALITIFFVCFIFKIPEFQFNWPSSILFALLLYYVYNLISGFDFFNIGEYHEELKKALYVFVFMMPCAMLFSVLCKNNLWLKKFPLGTTALVTLILFEACLIGFSATDNSNYKFSGIRYFLERLDSNSLSHTGALIIIIIVHDTFQPNNRWDDALRTIAVFFAFVLLSLGGSIGVWAAFSGALLINLFNKRNAVLADSSTLSNITFVGSIIGFSLTFGFNVKSISILDRLIGSIQNQTSSIYSRMDAYKSVVGEASLSKIYSAHNILLDIYFTSGILASILFFVVSAAVGLKFFMNVQGSKVIALASYLFVFEYIKALTHNDLAYSVNVVALLTFGSGILFCNTLQKPPTRPFWSRNKK